MEQAGKKEESVTDSGKQQAGGHLEGNHKVNWALEIPQPHVMGGEEMAGLEHKWPMVVYVVFAQRMGQLTWDQVQILDC